MLGQSRGGDSKLFYLEVSWEWEAPPFISVLEVGNKNKIKTRNILLYSTWIIIMWAINNNMLYI